LAVDKLKRSLNVEHLEQWLGIKTSSREGEQSMGRIAGNLGRVAVVQMKDSAG
jgi:hypothetical protein